jgi:hypothetical protein
MLKLSRLIGQTIEFHHAGSQSVDRVQVTPVIRGDSLWLRIAETGRRLQTYAAFDPGISVQLEIGPRLVTIEHFQGETGVIRMGIVAPEQVSIIRTELHGKVLV